MSAAASLSREEVERYLAEHERRELVRFVTVGSVDDGKSTLIGRLLHDTHGVYDDQLAAVRKASASRNAGPIDFSLFTDGLRAEREQGITIDVAYRYFSTERRKFIIADTPGHEQYTRNMATGASTADIAVTLLDARLGVLEQSRRHAIIASLLGIRHLIVAVNKMDLVGFAEDRFRELTAAFGAVVSSLGFETVSFVPVSARDGDNVVTPSARAPWYDGETILGLLETLPVARDASGEPLRFVVQTVLRPHLDYRGFAGYLASGAARPGDEVVVLPSHKKTRILAIDTFEGALAEARAPMSVVLRATDEVDVSRGDMFAARADAPPVCHEIEAHLVWLSERPFDRSRRLLCKHTARLVPARIEAIAGKVSLLDQSVSPAEGIGLNDIVLARVAVSRPLFVAPYRASRALGAFILIDAISNETVAAGMVVRALDADVAVTETPIGLDERERRHGHRSVLVRVGPAAAIGLERILFRRGVEAVRLDGHALGGGGQAGELGLGWLRSLLDAGLVVLCSGVDDATWSRLASDLGASRALDASTRGTAEEAAALVSERTALDVAHRRDPGDGSGI